MGLPEQERFIAAYNQTSQTITDAVKTSLVRQWNALTGWRDADAAPFLVRVLPLIEAGMTQQAAITDAYLSLMLSDQLGKSIPPRGVDSIRDIRGVPSSEVYTRPFKTTRAAIGEGLTFRESAERGLTRLVDIFAADNQLARTHTARNVLSKTSGVVGYRRVLSGSENCGMCVVASSQRYHRGDLMPIHPGCDCKVAPIAGNQDPGQIIDAQRLEGAHDAIAERFGTDAVDRGARDIDYRKVLLVQEHGELGPVLTVKGQNFTGPI